MRRGSPLARAVVAAVLPAASSCSVLSVESIPEPPPPATQLETTAPVPRPSKPGCPEAVHQPWASATKVDELPEAITRVNPAYPDTARERRVSGTVQLSVLVCEHGRVIETLVTRSIPLLDEAAQNAADGWVFKPATQDQRPVSAWVPIPFRFSLH